MKLEPIEFTSSDSIISASLPDKKYQIIYSDPPWRYSNPKGNDPKLGGITYPTMTLEEICNLPVSQIAAQDSVLFRWATMPMLTEALQVMNAWGFQYRTVAFVWVKLNPSGAGIYSGLGHWTNQNAELVLFGKRGHPKRQSRSIKQIIMAPRGRHSAKPPEIRDRIVELMGDLPRIELFARKPKNQLFEDESFKVWDLWGNEAKADE